MSVPTAECQGKNPSHGAAEVSPGLILDSKQILKNCDNVKEQEKFTGELSSNLFFLPSHIPNFSELSLTVQSRNPRLRWNLELRSVFEEAVAVLGGASKSTPRKIMELMSTKKIFVTEPQVCEI